MADLGGKAVERRRVDRERREKVRVPVTLNDLRRRRRRLEPEPLARNPLHLGVRGAVCADGSGQLPDAHPLESTLQTRTVAIDRERPAGELEPKRRRLCMYSVRTTDRDRLAMLLRTAHHDSERTVEPIEHERPGLL